MLSHGVVLSISYRLPAIAPSSEAGARQRQINGDQKQIKAVACPRNQQSRIRRLRNGGGVFAAAGVQQGDEVVDELDGVAVARRRHLDLVDEAAQRASAASRRKPGWASAAWRSATF